jgi:hypothetical protein
LVSFPVKICGPNVNNTHEQDQAFTREDTATIQDIVLQQKINQEGSANLASINHGASTNIASICPTATGYITKESNAMAHNTGKEKYHHSRP